MKVKIPLLQVWTRPQDSRKLRLPEFLDNRHMKLVKLKAQSTGRLYPQEIFMVIISVRSSADPIAKVRPEGLRQRNIPITSLGIESATFQLVAQCLNHLRHSVCVFVCVCVYVARIYITHTYTHTFRRYSDSITIFFPLRNESWLKTEPLV